MTAEERIVQLEAALALERAKVHELSAALAEAVSADAHAKRVAADRKAARAAQNRAAYERRKQASVPIQRAESGAEVHAESPSPLLDGSPLSSKPSLPSPLSSPLPVSSSKESQAIPERPELVLEAQKPGRKPRKPSAAERLFSDLQQMREDRCDEVGEPIVEETWAHGRQNRDLKPLVEASSEAQALFERAWGLYLADDGQRVREPAWSLSWFMMVRAQYETRAAREAAEGEAA